MNPYLLILSGIPSSGKTTLEESLASLMVKRNIPTVIISSDVIRSMLRGEKFNPDFETFVAESLRSCVENALKKGYLVICDDLNYYESMRRKLKDIALKTGSDYGIVFISTPPETAKEWNRKRGNKIPEELIDEIYFKLDIPGKKYRWDKPIYTVDLSREEVEKAAKEIIKKMEKSFKKKDRKKEALQSSEKKVCSTARDIERETRRAMGEIMREYKPAEVAREISQIRKEVVRIALESGLSPEKAVEEFLSRVKPLLTSAEISPERKISLNIGLFGHIDHGKTSIARCLTQTPSTASLDRHPEAQKRGMTIDMGFSAFETDTYLVTLVDLPGHHSLMNHVTGGASIIDGAILVIDAVDGINVQTVEHFALIRGLGLKLVIALNKCDLASEERIKEVENKINKMLSGYPAKIVKCSARNCSGIEELKKVIEDYISPPVRNTTGVVKIPIDHSFHIPGAGTVVTGTILRGKIRKGDTLYVLPDGIEVRIRGIQIFKKDVESAKAGERVALSLTGVKPEEIERGSVLSSQRLSPANFLKIRVKKEKFYSHKINQGEIMHIGSGLITSTCSIYPIEYTSGIAHLSEASEKFDAIVKLSKPVIIEPGDRIMLYRADLQPKEVRVVGIGEVVEVYGKPPEIFRKKVKKVKFVREQRGYIGSLRLDRNKHLEYVIINGKKLRIDEFRDDGILIRNVGEGEYTVEFFRRVSL